MNIWEREFGLSRPLRSPLALSDVAYEIQICFARTGRRPKPVTSSTRAYRWRPQQRVPAWALPAKRRGNAAHRTVTKGLFKGHRRLQLLRPDCRRSYRGRWRGGAARVPPRGRTGGTNAGLRRVHGRVRPDGVGAEETRSASDHLPGPTTACSCRHPVVVWQNPAGTDLRTPGMEEAWPALGVPPC